MSLPRDLTLPIFTAPDVLPRPASPPLPLLLTSGPVSQLSAIPLGSFPTPPQTSWPVCYGGLLLLSIVAPNDSFYHLGHIVQQADLPLGL